MLRAIFESIVDYAHATLDQVIWDLSGEKPKLRQEIKNYVIDYIKRYEAVDIPSLMENIHIVGSSATYQWREDADLDVHILPKKGVKSDEELLELRDAVKRFTRVYPDYIGEHRIELYIQIDPKQDYLGDAVYDFNTDEWDKEPVKIDLEFDPESEFREILDKTLGIMNKVDSELGKIKREVIDVDQLKSFLKTATPDQRSWLKPRLQKKIAEIETTIKNLVKEKGIWVQLRKAGYDPTAAWDQFDKSRSWADRNIQFKLLQRYKYIDVLTALEDLIKDDSLTYNDIDVVKRIVGGG